VQFSPSPIALAAVPDLTAEQSNGAVRSLRSVSVFFGVGLENIVDSVVRSYGAEVSEPTQEKLSTVCLDRHQRRKAPDVRQGLS
jgi:hypothetical protein